MRVRTSRESAVRITIERKKGKRWVRVARKTRTTSRGRVSLTVKRLSKGLPPRGHPGLQQLRHRHGAFEVLPRAVDLRG